MHIYLFINFKNAGLLCFILKKITQHTCELSRGGKRTDVHLHYQAQKTFRTAMSDVLTIT